MMSCLYFTKNSIIFPNLSTEVQVKENCSTEQFIFLVLISLSLRFFDTKQMNDTTPAVNIKSAI